VPDFVTVGAYETPPDGWLHVAVPAFEGATYVDAVTVAEMPAAELVSEEKKVAYIEFEPVVWYVISGAETVACTVIAETVTVAIVFDPDARPATNVDDPPVSGVKDMPPMVEPENVHRDAHVDTAEIVNVVAVTVHAYTIVVWRRAILSVVHVKKVPKFVDAVGENASFAPASRP
jgi:hypothetical protein